VLFQMCTHIAYMYIHLYLTRMCGGMYMCAHSCIYVRVYACTHSVNVLFTCSKTQLHYNMQDDKGHFGIEHDDSLVSMLNSCIRNPLAQSLSNGHELSPEEYRKADGYMETLLDDISKSTSQAEIKLAGAKYQAKLPPCSNSGCSKVGILQCSKCKAVKYCGKDCQKSHWTEAHKKQCKQ